MNPDEIIQKVCDNLGLTSKFRAVSSFQDENGDLVAMAGSQAGGFVFFVLPKSNRAAESRVYGLSMKRLYSAAVRDILDPQA